MMLRKLSFLLTLSFLASHLFAQPAALPAFVKDSLDAYVKRNALFSFAVIDISS